MPHDQLGEPNKQIAARLERLRRSFVKTGHPFGVWWAYHVSRQADCDVPEWVLEEFDGIFDRIVDAIHDVIDERGTDRYWGSRVAEIFGFRTTIKGGPVDPFHDYFRDEEAFELATRVRVLIDGDGQNQTDACYLVARDLTQNGMDVSATRVRRAWHRFEELVRSDDLEKQRERIEHGDGRRAGHSRRRVKARSRVKKRVAL